MGALGVVSVVSVRGLRAGDQSVVYVGRCCAGWPASALGNPFRLGPGEAAGAASGRFRVWLRGVVAAGLSGAALSGGEAAAWAELAAVGGPGAGGAGGAAGVLVRSGRGDMPCVRGAGGGAVPGRSGVGSVGASAVGGWSCAVVSFFRLGGVLCLLLLLVRSSVCRRFVRFRCSLACVVVGSRGGGRQRAVRSCGCACVRAGCGVPVRSRSGPILRVGSVVSGPRGLPFGPNVLRPHPPAPSRSRPGGGASAFRRAVPFFPPSLRRPRQGHRQRSAATGRLTLFRCGETCRRAAEA